MGVITIKLRSKLSSTAYKRADPAAYLVGDWWKELDPLFVGRLAYAAMAEKCKIASNSAYRSHEEQKRLYAMYQEYLRTGKGSIKLAAVPGTSRHEYRMAVDTSTQPIRSMTSAQLKKYGLCKPIASEPWHIEPIELEGKSISIIKRDYLPEEVEDLTEAEVRKLIAESQTVYKMPADVPSWAKPNIERMIKKGFIAPSEKDGSINLTHEMVRVLAIVDRMVG